MSLKEYFQKLNSNVSLVVRYIKTIGEVKENKSMGQDVFFLLLLFIYARSYLKW